jgi:hypothetical protein
MTDEEDHYPTDLVPLPTAPWDERPAELPLDAEECRTALWLKRGNVLEASRLLKVDPSRLRRFVNKSARLREVEREAREQLADIAEANILDALTDDEDYARRDSMSKFVLTTLGKQRGFSSSSTVALINRVPQGPIEFSWAGGPTIDVTPNEEDK